MFFCCCYYTHYAMIMTKKNKLFFIPILLSLHSYHQDKILFCYCYYVHYAMITTRNKLIFILTLPLLHNYQEKNIAVLFPSGSSVVLKDWCVIQQFHRQEFQWRVLVFFSPRKFSVFKRFVHDTLVPSSGTSVESQKEILVNSTKVVLLLSRNTLNFFQSTMDSLVHTRERKE